MWKFWIDTGGTFTDCLAESPAGERLRAKVLSSSSLRGTIERIVHADRFRLSLNGEYEDGFFEGYELQVFSGSETYKRKIREWREKGVK